MEEHPFIAFSDGPAGRWARLSGGPDVWEVIGAISSARSAEPELDADQVVLLVAETAGLALQQIRAALAYWADYPAEVDEIIRRARDEADQAIIRWEREHDLLGR